MVSATSTRPRPMPPARSTGARTPAPPRRGTARPRASRSPGSPACAGAAPAGRTGSAWAVYCTDRYKRGSGMSNHAELPESYVAAGDVSGKRVVITGASRGLGRLLAHAFSAAGARVALVARNEKDLKELGDELPGSTIALSGDVTDDAFNEAVADATVAEWGGLEVWICNAGISPIVSG